MPPHSNRRSNPPCPAGRPAVRRASESPPALAGLVLPCYGPPWPSNTGRSYLPPSFAHGARAASSGRCKTRSPRDSDCSGPSSGTVRLVPPGTHSLTRPSRSYPRGPWASACSRRHFARGGRRREVTYHLHPVHAAGIIRLLCTKQPCHSSDNDSRCFTPVNCLRSFFSGARLVGKIIIANSPSSYPATLRLWGKSALVVSAIYL